jgi:hypothetical protein
MSILQVDRPATATRVGVIRFPETASGAPEKYLIFQRWTSGMEQEVRDKVGPVSFVYRAERDENAGVRSCKQRPITEDGPLLVQAEEVLYVARSQR